MKIVVTVVGKDRVGIIATVSSLLAENKVNILSINQNIMDGFFNMVMLAETTEDAVKLGELALQLLEVAAGGKAAALAGQDERTHRVVLLGPADGVVDLMDKIRRKGIERLRPVQRQPRHALLHAVEGSPRLLIHGVPSLCRRQHSDASGLYHFLSGALGLRGL